MRSISIKPSLEALPVHYLQALYTPEGYPVRSMSLGRLIVPSSNLNCKKKSPEKRLPVNDSWALHDHAAF